MTQLGVAPLSYGTIADWCRLRGRNPNPAEVDALIELDAALMHHTTPEAKPVDEPKPTPAWPKRKGAPSQR